MPRNGAMNMDEGITRLDDPSTQIVILVEQKNFRIEPADLKDHLAAHQQTGAKEKGRATIAFRGAFQTPVVLQIGGKQGPVGEEYPTILLHNARRQNRRNRLTLSCLKEAFNCAGMECNVRIDEQCEGDLDSSHACVHGPPEALVAGIGQNACAAIASNRNRIVTGSVIDQNGGDMFSGERQHAFAKNGATVMGHHDRRNITCGITHTFTHWLTITPTLSLTGQSPLGPQRDRKRPLHAGALLAKPPPAKWWPMTSAH